MAIVELGNVYSTVWDISVDSVHALDDALSVITPNYVFAESYQAGYWDGLTRFYDAGKCRFPTGLVVDAIKAIRRAGEKVEIVDSRTHIDVDIPDKITLLHEELGTITLRDYQYDSVVKGLEATRGIVNIATNGGKTEVACGIMQTILPALKEGERIVFLTHSKEIFIQSHKRIQERLGIKVGKIGDGKWEDAQIVVAMIPTITKNIKKPKTLPNIKKYKDMKEELESLKIGAEAGSSVFAVEYKAKKAEVKAYEKEQWAKIKDNVARTKGFLDSVVAFVVDEAHHSSADTWYKVLMALENAYYRFGLTGTISDKADDRIDTLKLHSCTGDILTKVSNKFLIEEGHSAKPTINMLSMGKIKAVIHQPYFEARRLGIIENKIRNDIFVSKILERAKIGKQCLIIVNETEHGDIVHSLVEGHGVSVKFMHGDKTDKYRKDTLEELKTGDLQVLIATSILDEGVDVSGINCLFLMAGGRSMRQLLQRIGRGLRKKEDGSGLEVYDALDYHNEYLVDHTMERYGTYKKEGFDIVKL
jgi:superfamily II DNA or RNA helicase